MPHRNGVFVPWQVKVPLKHLMTEDESPDAIRASMNNIYQVLKATPAFNDFEERDSFRGCDDVDDANYYLDLMYDYADENLIWIM